MDTENYLPREEIVTMLLPTVEMKGKLIQFHPVDVICQMTIMVLKVQMTYAKE
jgi:hypothetical protein